VKKQTPERQTPQETPERHSETTTPQQTPQPQSQTPTLQQKRQRLFQTPSPKNCSRSANQETKKAEKGVNWDDSNIKTRTKISPSKFPRCFSICFVL